MMPKRYSPKERAILIGFIIERDGEECRLCHKEPSELASPLQIDHIDGDHFNRAHTNLRLLCQSCNQLEMHRLKREGQSTNGKTPQPRNGNGRWVSTVVAAKGDLLRCVSVTKDVPNMDGGAAIRRVVMGVSRYSDGSPEMRAAEFFEPPFTEWLMATLRQRGHLTYKDAADAGAQVVGCNPMTTRRYLDKLCSFEGPCEIVPDAMNRRVVVLREMKPALGANNGHSQSTDGLASTTPDSEMAASGEQQ